MEVEFKSIIEQAQMNMLFILFINEKGLYENFLEWQKEKMSNKHNSN